MAQKSDPPDLNPKQQQLICALLTANSKAQAAKLAGVAPRTMYRWFHDPVFMEAYREVRRNTFDDMMASIEKVGNNAARALGRELYRAEMRGGGLVLINVARTIIDFAIKSQSIMAVQEELERMRRVMEAMGAGQAPTAIAGGGQQIAGSQEPEKPPAPAAEKPAECTSMMTEQDTAEACRLRMLWMSEIGNSPQDVADSLRWNRPQSVAEEQGLLDVARRQLEWEKQFTGGQFTGRQFTGG